MKLRQLLSGFIVALTLAFNVAPLASADISIIGPDGKKSSAEIDEKKVNEGIGKIVLWGGLVFAGVLSVGGIVTSIAMGMGKREWVKEHLINIIGSILLFAFSSAGVTALVAAVA